MLGLWKATPSVLTLLGVVKLQPLKFTAESVEQLWDTFKQRVHTI